VRVAKQRTHADAERFIAALRKAITARPHERFGQLIANAIPRSHAMPELFYLDDDRMTASLEAYARTSPLAQKEAAGG